MPPLGETPNQESKLSLPISAWCAGAFGAFILCVGDLASRNSSSTVRNVEAVVKEFTAQSSYSGYFAVMLIVLLGVGLCWVFEVKSKGEGLTRGMSVFAVLAMLSAYGSEQPRQGSIKIYSVPAAVFYAEATQKESQTDVLGQVFPQANATIGDNEWVSSCKPNYDGLVRRITAFFNNVIYTCDVGYRLTPGQRVRIIEFWDTAVRGYRYARVQYLHTGQVHDGWVPAGRSPDFWFYIQPDDSKNAVAKPIDAATR